MRISFLSNLLIGGLALSTLCGSSFTSTLQAQNSVSLTEESSPDQKFLKELLDRGFFRLAELHCRNRLASETLSPAIQAELTLELIRVLQEKALCVPAPQKKELDLQTQNLYDDFRKSNMDCPWLLIVDFQYAVGIFAQAKRAEMEARFAFDAEKSMEEARELAREAIRRFLEVDTNREKAVLALAQEGNILAKPSKKSGKKLGKKPELFSSRFSEEGLSLYELESLKNQLQFQLLLAYQLQAMTYPEDSLDRMTSLKEAQSRAGNLTIIPSGSELYWKARLEEIRCLRLQKNFEDTGKRLDFLADQIENTNVLIPEELRLEMIAEQIRLHLAEKDLEKALQIIKSEFHVNLLGKNGELDCAILELWLAQWDEAMKKNANGEKNEEEVRKFQEGTIEILNAIRAKSSPWWIRKAEILFNGMMKNTGEKQNLSFLQMAAENSSVNFDPDTVRACDKLWEAAISQKNTETALHAVKMAGSFLYQNKRKTDAANWFRKFSVTFPEHPSSMENHSLSVKIESENIAEALDSANGKLNDSLNAKLDQFQMLILEHFQMFGKKDPEIKSLLQKLETITRIRQNFAECVDVSMLLAANTSPEDESFPEIINSCFENWRRYLESLQREKNEEYPRALFTAIQWSETLPPSANRASGSFFLLCSIDSLNSRFSQKEKNELTETEKNFQKKLLETEIRLFQSIKPFLDTFSNEIREEIEQIGTHAMILTGNREEAFPFYEKLAQKFPNRLEIQFTWGQLLAEKALRENEKSLLTQALTQWRQIERHVKDSSTEWYEAKYWIIRLQAELGETKLAARLFRTFRILHPDLGGDEHKKRFLELADSLNISLEKNQE